MNTFIKQTSLLIVTIFSLLSLSSSYAETLNQQQTQAFLDKIREMHHIPALQATILQQHNQQTYVSGHVTTDKDSAKITHQHLFQIGSITKMFVASVLVQLQQESESGQLGQTFSLDQTVGEWLPQYPDWSSITVRQLLNMTSGIVEYLANDDIFNHYLDDPYSPFSTDQLIDAAYQQSPNIDFAPGSRWQYSNTNYQLAGQIIQAVTGNSVKQELQTRLFDRLNLHNTYYIESNINDQILANMAHGYNQQPDLPFNNLDVTEHTLSWASAAGGIISNSEDLAHWYQQYFAGKVIGDLSELRQSVVCIYEDDDECHEAFDGYSLGMFRFAASLDSDGIWFHPGATLGYNSVLIRTEQGDIISVLASHASDNFATATGIGFSLFGSIEED